MFVCNARAHVLVGLCVLVQASSKKESILELNKFMDQGVRVKFQGGREGWCCCACGQIFHPPSHVAFVMTGHVIMDTVTGTLKGFDQLVNLVLDETVEYLRGQCFVWLGLVFDSSYAQGVSLIQILKTRIALRMKQGRLAWSCAEVHK